MVTIPVWQRMVLASPEDTLNYLVSSSERIFYNISNFTDRKTKRFFVELLALFQPAWLVFPIIVNMYIPILVSSLNNCVEKGMHLISATNILSAQNAVSEMNKILTTNMIYRNLEINFYQSALRYRIRY